MTEELFPELGRVVWVTCPECHGATWVQRPYDDDRIHVTCDECHGAGRVRTWPDAKLVDIQRIHNQIRSQHGVPAMPSWLDASNMGATDPPRPIHGDVWRTRTGCHRFSVMHVCGRHDPPDVTGYWWGDDGPNPDLHDSIPLPRFTSSMDLVEREDFDA